MTPSPPAVLSRLERLILERYLARLNERRPGPARALALGLSLLIVGPVVVGALGLILAVVIYISLAGQLQDGLRRIQSLDRRESFQTMRIRDRHGTLLREVFSEGKRTYVPLADIPQTVKDATVAVEDKNFYTNAGVDALAVLRAAWGTLRRAGGNAGGASTISQQFVRHVAFSYDERMARSYTRKLKEIVLAIILNQKYSKNQILEWYLNEIYYGNLAYGIEAAAQAIFGKPAKQLTLAESAILVGLPQAPADLDPLNPDPAIQAAVRRRQQTVLHLMVENGRLAQAEADRAAAEPLVYAKRDEGRFLAPHFVVYVQKLLEERFGSDLLRLGGLEVTTSLDLDIQNAAQDIVAKQVDKLKDANHLTNAALVAMEPRTGQVLAMVGSVDYWNDAVDGRVNVAVRERQPGSSIKPITYATALAMGIPASTFTWDVPMKLPLVSGMYEPKNYDDKFHGPVRMRAALANSYNIPALKVLRLAGVENMIATAHKMGITGLRNDPGYYGLSVTLGGGEVTLLDMVTAFGTFANGGGLVRPHPILTVTESSGKVLFDLQNDPSAFTFNKDEGVDPRAAYIITNWLSDNAARAPAFGTSSPLVLPVKAAVKTGTTNDNRDNWTVGYTPYLAIGVWAGNSDNTAMKRTSGVTGAAPIWNAAMRAVVENKARLAVVKEARSRFGFKHETDFKRPKGIVEKPVCRLGSLRTAVSTCLEMENELFIEGTMPITDDWTSVPAVAVPKQVIVAAADDPGVPADAAAGASGAVTNTVQLCQAVDVGLDKVQPVAVLPLPDNADGDELAEVLTWAEKTGWPALPPSAPCTPEMADAALAPGSLAGDPSQLAALLAGGAYAPTVRAAYHLELAPGSVLSSRTELTGTVVYNPVDVVYYKVELGRVEPNGHVNEWITLGDIHHGPVTGGVLEVLDAPSVAPGNYLLQLVLVKNDGNFVEPPQRVPVQVVRPSDQTPTP